MKFERVLIYKPGCTLEPKPNKTNLQIRELESFRAALADANVKAELTTFEYISAHALDLTGCAIIVFNSAHCFQDEFAEFMRIMSVIDDIDLTLVSNDCRLNFKLGDKTDKFVGSYMQHFFDTRAGLRILTNASKDLEDYKNLIIDWPHSDMIPIHYAGLFTLPSWMEGAEVTEKTVASVFACMHFCDYSDERKLALTKLKESLGDSMVLTGDMSGMFVDAKEVKSVVTDTKTVWQWYKNACTTPVLLEPNYDRFGVLPNRVSEAISCRCLPVMMTTDLENYRNIDDLSIPIVGQTIDENGDIASIEHLLNVITDYVAQYNTESVQQLLDRLQVQLGHHRTTFVYQLQNIYAV